MIYPNGTLFIGGVDKSTDEGEYRCVVRNSKGEQAQSSFQLIIQGKCLLIKLFDHQKKKSGILIRVILHFMYSVFCSSV